MNELNNVPYFTAGFAYGCANQAIGRRCFLLALPSAPAGYGSRGNAALDSLERKSMNPKVFMIASAGIIGVLGVVHFVLTFWGSKHRPRDRSLVDAMVNTTPIITTQTSVWKMWMGFNASHSICLLFYGLIYIYLALAHSEVLFTSLFLQALGFIMLVGYAVLARIYWFILPLAAFCVSLILFLISLVLAWTA